MPGEDAVKGMESELGKLQGNIQGSLSQGERIELKDWTQKKFWEGEAARDKEQTDLLKEQQNQGGRGSNDTPDTRDEAFDPKYGNGANGVENPTIAPEEIDPTLSQEEPEQTHSDAPTEEAPVREEHEIVEDKPVEDAPKEPEKAVSENAPKEGKTREDVPEREASEDARGVKEPIDKEAPKEPVKNAPEANEPVKAEAAPVVGNGDTELSAHYNGVQSARLDSYRESIAESGNMTPEIDSHIAATRETTGYLEQLYNKVNDDPSKPATLDNMSQKFGELSKDEKLPEEARESFAKLQDLSHTMHNHTENIRLASEGTSYLPMNYDMEQTKEVAKDDDFLKDVFKAEKEGKIRTDFSDVKDAMNTRVDNIVAKAPDLSKAQETGEKTVGQVAQSATKNAAKTVTKTAEKVKEGTKAAAKVTGEALKAGLSMGARAICFTNPYTAIAYIAVKLALMAISKTIEAVKDANAKVEEKSKEQTSGTKQVGDVAKTEKQQKNERAGKVGNTAPERAI